jgi:hypothetical protein
MKLLESLLILLIGVGFNIGATILTDYAFRYYKVREMNPVTRWTMTRLGRKGRHIASMVLYAVIIVWGIFFSDGLWGLLVSIVFTLACGYDFFHDLKEYSELRRKQALGEKRKI